MKKIALQILFRVAPLLALTACVGPTVDSAKYYTLEALPTGERPAQRPKEFIGVYRVEMPQYLDTQSVVSRTGAHEVYYADNARWAGSLPPQVSMVVAKNLTVLLGNEKVFIVPSRFLEVKPDFYVYSRIRKWEGSLGGEAVLCVHWVILNREKKPCFVQEKTYSVAAGETYPEYVKALNTLLENWTADIACALENVRQAK